MERFLFDFLKAVWIGGTLTVPGVSGGTMAMILGVYERLLSAVNSLKSGLKWNKYTRFLLIFSIGGAVGIFTFSGFVTNLLKRFPSEMVLFFTGAVAGGVPVIWGEIKKLNFRWGNLLYLVVGVGTVFGITLIPQGLFSLSTSNILLQMIGGIIAAAALVLPGISVSHILYVFGMYETLMDAVAGFKVLTLLPFAIGLITGVLCCASALEYLLSRFKAQAYMVILGFVGGSVFEMITEMSEVSYSPVHFLFLILGYLSIFLMFKYNKAGA